MSTPCSVEGCEKPLLAKGLCSKHYRRQRLYGSPDGAAYAPKACRIDGCPRAAESRGLCDMHYQRLRLTGATGEAALRRAPTTGECLLAGCGRPQKALGYCELHYDRVKKTGEPGPVGRKRVPHTSPTCVIDGCDKASTASKGMCPMHYYRLRVHGDPGPAAPQKRPKGSGGLTHRGYVLVTGSDRWPDMLDKQGRCYEHRLVMADKLGRALLPGETVHHKDGVRDNNAPDNLVLYAGNHGSGQSVEDKLAAAEALLARYAPEKLA